MTNPYELWNTRKSLGVIRDVEPAPNYWLELAFGRTINFTTEYVDFEKLPVSGRKLAPFVRPLGTGKPIYTDSASAFRFKPAYVKVKDSIDPTAPLVKIPGVDRSMLDDSELSPEQRRNLLRTAMTVQHVQSIQRTWEWLAARAVIDARVTIEGEEYPAVELDFQRNANHRVQLNGAARWGQNGVKIFAFIQQMADRMFNAEFGAFPNRITLSPAAWAIMREDTEILAHMDTQIRGAAATVERGIISAEKVVKVGALNVGGASGAVIDLYLYRDTYKDYLTGVETPFMEDGDIVMTGSNDAIGGYRCYGAIIDPNAQYRSVDIFGRNWMEQGDPAVEYLLHQSAPLMVPINPNATLRASVCSPSAPA